MKNFLAALGFVLSTMTSGLAAPPANDDFVNAQVLPPQRSVTNIEGTNVDATAEPADPRFPRDGGGGASVWYAWTAPDSGRVALTAANVGTGTTKDAVVMHGSALATAKIITGGFATARPVPFFAVAGQTYYFCIYTIPRNTGAFRISVGYTAPLPASTLFSPPLANDDYANATLLTGSAQTAVLYCFQPTLEGFEPEMLAKIKVGLGRSIIGGIWAQWTAPAAGRVAVTASSIRSEAVTIVVGSGENLDVFRERIVTSGRGGASFTAQAGKNYQFYFRVADDDQLAVTLAQGRSGSTGATAPFSAHAGTYYGLVGPGGMLKLTLTKTGSFTGTLIFNGLTYSLGSTGKLDADGDFNGTAGRSTLPLTLDLDMTAATANPRNIKIAGTAGGQAFTIHRTAFTRTVPLTETGTYTTLLAATQNTATVPGGTGFATLKVARSGLVTFSGRLAEGSAFTAPGVLVGDGNGGTQFIVFTRAIHGGKGRLSGAIAFAQSSTQDCGATLDWVKPNVPGARYYAAAFDTDLALIGARYVAPVRAMALDLPAGPDNVNFAATRGGVVGTHTEILTLTALNQILVSGANPQAFKMRLVPATGAFSGSFIHPELGTLVTFSGLLYQKTTSQRAAGFFLVPLADGTGLSGNVQLIR